MKAICLFTGFAFFGLALAVHFLIGRLFKIAKEILGLLLIFLLGAPIVLAGVYIGSHASFVEFYASLCVYLSLALVYLQTYPALKTEIPTFQLLLLIDEAKTDGLSMREVQERMKQNNELYSIKMVELESDGLLKKHEGHFILSRTGKLLADTFIMYRRVLGLKTGRG